jgi:hypothetical protein
MSDGGLAGFLVFSSKEHSKSGGRIQLPRVVG